MNEHLKEDELQEGQKCTQSTNRQSQSEQNKSAITDAHTGLRLGPL